MSRPLSGIPPSPLGLNIAVVSHDVFWPVRGGGGIRVYWATRLFLSRGHNVSVIAPFLHGDGLAKVFPDVRIHSIGRITRFSSLKELQYIILMLRSFVCLMAVRADVIYAQNVVAGFPAVLAGRLLRIPVVFDMIDLLTGYSKNTFVYRLGPRFEKWVMKHADFVIVTSRNLKVLGEAVGVWRLEQVRHGVDLRIFHPRSGNRKWIVFAGGIEKNDGVLLIPEAAKIILSAGADRRTASSDIRFLFVGEGKALPALVRKVRDLGLSDRFEFRGWVEQAELPPILADSRLGLIPSLNVAGTSYAYPLRSIECMAAGIPFVASDLEGIREQTEGSGGGLLFRPGSAEDLANAMLRLLENPSLSGILGRKGRRWAVRNADWRKNALRICEICEETVQKRKSA